MAAPAPKTTGRHTLVAAARPAHKMNAASATTAKNHKATKLTAKQMAARKAAAKKARMARASHPTGAGTTHVKGYTYTKNGKAVHVKPHTRANTMHAKAAAHKATKKK
jgi:hypothetical protein